LSRAAGIRIRGVHISKQQLTLEGTMVRTATLADGIFADSMLQTSWAQRSRRSWTTLTSFGLQAVIVGLLLLVPLLRTVGLPTARTVSTPISAGRHDPEPLPAMPRGRSITITTIPMPGRIMEPARIPNVITRGDDEPSLQPPGGSGNGIEGVGLPGPSDGIPNILASGNHPVMPTPPPASVSRIFRTSSMLQGALIHSVQPVYPPLARTARIQGAVVLSAVIAKDGSIEGLHALAGHPMLVTAAVEAVRQWRYRPYILNNEVIEVETQITVNFTLAGN
jgi:periplasmic protein TonB